MADWTVKINTPQNSAGPNVGPRKAMQNRNQSGRRGAISETDDDTEEIGQEEEMDAARAAVDLEKEKALARKEILSEDMAAAANQTPENEFASLGHGDIGGPEGPEPTSKEEETPPAEQPEEEGQEPEARAPQGTPPADQAQQQAQRQGFFANMMMRQKQAAKQKMQPIDQKIKTEQKQLDEIQDKIKKNTAKISSGKNLDRLGCCIMVIPGLGWAAGLIIRILRAKSKAESKKAEIENHIQEAKKSIAEGKIAKLRKQRQRLARQAGTK